MILPHIQFGFTVEAKSASRPFIRQVHGRNLYYLEWETESLIEADAIYTALFNRSIHIYTADCMGLLLFSSSAHMPIAAVHCGWSGAREKIVTHVIDRLGIPKKDLWAAIGPAIGPCCFQVREDFVTAMSERRNDFLPYLEKRGGLYFDLLRFVIETELFDIPKERILNHSRCTVCSLPALPSFRRSRSTDPHIRVWIQKHK